MDEPLDEVDRYAAVRQYSLAQILGVWAAAAVPMGVLAWIVAPWLRDQLGGDEPLAQALLICLTAGLIWQFVLVLILIRRELGDLNGRACATPCGCGHPAIRRPAAWVEGSGGGCCLFVVLFALEQAVPVNPGPLGEGLRRFPRAPTAARTSSAERGAGSRWSSCSPSSTPCSARSCSSGGCCCRECRASSEGATGSPTGCCSRSTTCISRGAFPPALVDIFALAYPSRRFQSAWMGIIVHSAQSVVLIIIVLTLVLD